ncbi:MAG: hypothetical protein JNG88_11705 [Phycisphaerales bacterium]|nr:hypothetical protein [Phycisphaerales bacterium]
MTLTRTIVTLVVTLLVMLTVVVLRAETTRLQFESSRLDRQSDVLLEQFREQQLELARLRNPTMIRDRAADLRLGAEFGAAKPVAKDFESKKNTPAQKPPNAAKSGGAAKSDATRKSAPGLSAQRKSDSGKKPAKLPPKTGSATGNTRIGKPNTQD